MDKTRKIMKLLGIEDQRLRKEWISASEGSRFAETVRDFTEDIRKLGKSKIARTETAA